MPFALGIDSSTGDYGYIKVGADSVTPFRSDLSIVDSHKDSNSNDWITFPRSIPKGKYYIISVSDTNANYDYVFTGFQVLTGTATYNLFLSDYCRGYSYGWFTNQILMYFVDASTSFTFKIRTSRAGQVYVLQ